MEPVVIGYGGSTVAPESLDGALLAGIGKRVRVWQDRHPVVLVIGGGQPARRYIRTARELGCNETDLDRIGVQATRLNAQLVASVLRSFGLDVDPDIPATTDEAASRIAKGQRVVVMGGTTPGHSTDFVAAEVASKSKGRLIIATNVDGVYASDPRQDPDATRHATMTYQQLEDLVADPEWKQAGAAGVIDGPATRLITGAALETCVLDGRDLENLDQAVAGKDFHGTRIGGA